MKNSKVTAITDFLILVSSFTMLVCSILAMKFIVNSKRNVVKVMDNWSADAIIDIVPYRWRCPTGYKPLFNLTLPGITTKGCFCSSTNEVYFDSAICSKDITCTGWEQRDVTEFQVLRSITPCVKRYKLNRQKYLVITQNETCPDGFMNCGYIDYFKDILCLVRKPNNETVNQCPINYINISLIGDVEEKQHSRIRLDNHYELLFSNIENATSLIPVDFKVSENIPCFVKNRISNITEFFPYSDISKFSFGCDPFMDNNTQINETYLDRRYTKLDSIPYKYFYISNDIQNLPTVPNWNIQPDMSFSLFYRPFTFINTACLPWQDILKFDYLVNDSKITQFAIMCVYLSNLFIMGTFISLLTLSKIGSKFQNILIGFVKLVFSYSFIGVIFYLSDRVTNSSSFLNEMENIYNLPECLDPTTYFIVNFVYNVRFYFQKAVFYNSALFYLLFPHTFFVLVQTVKFIQKVYMRIRNRHRNKQARDVIKEFFDK